MAVFKLEQMRLRYLSSLKKQKTPVYLFRLLENFCCMNITFQEVLKVIKVFHK